MVSVAISNCSPNIMYVNVHWCQNWGTLVPSDQPHRDACKQSFTRPPPPPPRPRPRGEQLCNWAGLVPGPGLVINCDIANFITTEKSCVNYLLMYWRRETCSQKPCKKHREGISIDFHLHLHLHVHLISFRWKDCSRTKPRTNSWFMEGFMDTPWTELWRDVNTSRPTELHPAPPRPRPRIRHCCN